MDWSAPFQLEAFFIIGQKLCFARLSELWEGVLWMVFEYFELTLVTVRLFMANYLKLPGPGSSPRFEVLLTYFVMATM